MSVPLQTKWLWVPVPLKSLNLQISRLLWPRSFLTFRKLQNVDLLRKCKLQNVDLLWTHTWHDKITQPMHYRDEYSQQSSIIWVIWLNSQVFLHELRVCVFVSSYSPFTFRYCTCFQQGHSGNYRMLIHSNHLCDIIKTHNQDKTFIAR